MRTAYKFLAAGSVSPFTAFRWPGVGVWVTAPADGEASWVFGCRRGDLPYWLEHELWTIELDEPARESRYQISAPRGRLVRRLERWDDESRREYSIACALHARELALPALPSDLASRVARIADPDEIAEVIGGVSNPSAVVGYLKDATADAKRDAAATSYIACILAATLGGGQDSFEAERAWQARWLSERLFLDS